MLSEHEATDAVAVASRLPFSDEAVCCSGRVVGRQFDFARPPGLVEPGLERAVEAQDGEPALAGDGLDPVGLGARPAAAGPK